MDAVGFAPGWLRTCFRRNGGSPNACSASTCSLLLPEYIWLATGGKSQFNDRLMVLKGRKVTAFPDIDGYDEWRKKAKNYPMLDITISDILERNAAPEQR